MQKCLRCKHRFTWFEITQSVVGGYRDLVCPKCKTRLRAGFITRGIMTFSLIAIAGLSYLFQDRLNYSFGRLVLIYIGAALVVTTLLPFVARYGLITDEDG